MAKQTEEARKKISEGRKRYLAENPDRHPWKKNNKFKSIPCEKVKEFLKWKKISFIEEYQPLVDRGFSIDIAFPDIKIGIEINGNQHYNKDGSLKKYYQNRHDLIESTGWKLLELHYSIAFNLDKLELIIKDRENIKVDYSEYIAEQFKRKNKFQLEKEKKDKRKQKEIDSKKKALLNSNIDFSKFGWVQKASEILQITPQKVNCWMKKNMKTFYESNCFHRKQ